VQPYYSAGGIEIYHGDALDVLDAALIGEVATIVADPPYCSGGRNQGTARQNFSKSSRGEWFLTDNMGTDTYLWWLRQVGRRLFDTAQVGAHFYCFTDWRQYTNVVTASESVGWTLRTCIVWDKMRGGAMGSFWRNDHEFIPCFSKGPPRPLPNGGFFNTLHAVKPHGDEHATVKPVSIIQRLIEAGGLGLVLDPFMGSGTTLRAAKNLGRRAIGIEIEERYCEIAANRLAQQALPLEVPA
jgi:site-specific DNA-methyltransferase (adenine-specific)